MTKLLGSQAINAELELESDEMQNVTTKTLQDALQGQSIESLKVFTSSRRIDEQERECRK